MKYLVWFVTIFVSILSIWMLYHWINNLILLLALSYFDIAYLLPTIATILMILFLLFCWSMIVYYGRQMNWNTLEDKK